MSNVEEEEFSEWFDTLDTKLRCNELNGSTTCWRKLEGRNHNGISQFRWIREDRPLGEYFRFGILWNSTVDEYYEEGMVWHLKGYDRISLNVFIDASGTARYQAIWISPAKPKESVIEASVLDDEMAAERERLFTPWESLSVLQKRFDERTPRTCPLYQEMDPNLPYLQGRSIYTPPGEGFRFAARIFCNRLRFLRYHRDYTKDGFKLLNVSTAPDGKFGTQYAAVWVGEKDFERASLMAENLGISVAKPITEEEMKLELRR
ncbi:hypothetical protein [Luteolibacter sp. AS25]|uniref:hypothetical protein n=1 Tax=Luteolibacter sp. AS25 TaxID=3135776 RepID=UPI00398AAAD0